MDEAIDIIQTGGKVQKIQTVLCVALSSMSTIMMIFLPYLTKKPSFLCSSVDDYNPSLASCSELAFCSTNSDQINSKNTLFNWAYKFHLYCSKGSFSSNIIISFLLGGLLSSLLLGFVGDKFGRKKLYFYLTCVITASHFLFMICFNETLLVFTSFLMGIGSFEYAMSSIIVTEYLTRPNSAWLTSLNTSSGFVLSLILILIYVEVNNTFVLFLFFFLISAASSFYAFFYITESPSWLVSRNRINECMEMLRDISIINDRLPAFENINKERFGTDNIKIITETDFIWTIFSYKSQSKRLLIHLIMWFCSSLSFYFMEFEINYIEDSFNTKYLLNFLGIFIAEIVIGLLSDVLGRQKCTAYPFYICGLASFIFALSPEEHWIHLISLIFLLIGSSAVHSVLFIFTAEDFPTSIRCTVMAGMFFVSRIGALCGFALINNMSKPELACAFLSFAGGRLAEMLEDTHELILDDEVPENMGDLPFKKKAFRALRKEAKSGCSDLYFLTSDDESFNKGQIYV